MITCLITYCETNPNIFIFTSIQKKQRGEAMPEEILIRIVLAVIVGVLFGIVYCMRVLVLMERRVARIEDHIDKVVQKILREELIIERSIRKRK